MNPGLSQPTRAAWIQDSEAGNGQDEGAQGQIKRDPDENAGEVARTHKKGKVDVTQEMGNSAETYTESQHQTRETRGGGEAVGHDDRGM